MRIEDALGALLGAARDYDDADRSDVRPTELDAFAMRLEDAARRYAAEERRLSPNGFVAWRIR